MKFLSDNKVAIHVTNLYPAHYLYFVGADKQLFMQVEIKGKLYDWGVYFDSSRKKLQDMIKKGIKAFENTYGKLEREPD